MHYLSYLVTKTSYILTLTNIPAPKLAISAAWKLIPGGLTKISKGKSGVWGVNRVGGIYRLNGDGKE